MQIYEQHDVTSFNTFGIQAQAKFFTEVHNELEIKELLNSIQFKENTKLFLGGGSNILFTKDFDGIVILNALKGIEIVKEDDASVIVRSMGGEVWHDLVTFTVSRGYWGIENLALIPGTVGAAPMQNIGAYGVDLKNTLDTVEAIDIKTGEKRIFTNEECRFDYRDSIFKQELKDKYFITAITVQLQKNPQPQVSYKILAEYLEKNHIETTSPKNISEAVADIRRSKLPDPKVIGNAGSFFKNIFLPQQDFEILLKKYPEIPSFQEEGITKIPSAWLIEKCGWKGYRKGNVGVHDKQALVLVNHRGGTGGEIKKLAEEIIASVYEKFGLTLTTEVNFV
jgi:UDP-N-acetylmuramate dehydrogenase